MAEQVGYANPYRLQHLLGRARWDEEQVCAEVRDYIVEHLDDGAGILAVDETSFLKRGEESVGVGRQYCGLTGQIENCQVGVFLAYISSKGQSLLDRRLYLPKSWTKVRQRRQKAHIPSKVRFATKTGLAKGMLQSAIKAGIHPAWFVADEVYSRDASFWRWLEQTVRQPYVLTVNKRQPTPINFKTHYAEDLARTVPPEGWQRLSTGAGTKGERYYEWARVELSCRHPEGFSRWFLFRRCPEHSNDPSFISYYQVFAPSDTSVGNHGWGCRSTLANRRVLSIRQGSTRLGRLRGSLVGRLAPPRHFGFSSRGNLRLYCVIELSHLGNSQSRHFFLLASGLAIWLRSKRSVGSRPAQSRRTPPMGLEIAVSPILVFRVDRSLVFLAQTSSSSRSLPSLSQACSSSLELSTTVVQNIFQSV